MVYEGIFLAMIEEIPFPDPLAEATNGLFHWNDPGMDEFERGWEEFGLGMRVEARGTNGWHIGTIVETVDTNDRAIVVECDDVVHDNLDHLGGRGLTIPVYCNTRRGIWSNLRTYRDDSPMSP